MGGSSRLARTLVVGLWALGGACGDEPAFIRSAVELPRVPGARTLILGVDTRAGRELWALDPESDEVIEVAAEALPASPRHLVLALEPALDDLGLTSGARLPESADAGLRAFEAPAAAFAWSADRGDWRTLEPAAVPEEVREYRLPEAGCTRFGQARRLHLGRGRARFVVPLGPLPDPPSGADRALVGLDAATFVVTATSATTVEPQSFGVSASVRSAARGGDRLWVVDARGRVYAGLAALPLELERVVAPSAAAVGGYGGPDGEDVFLVGRGDATPIYRRGGEGWVAIGEAPGAVDPPVGIGPGRAILRALSVGQVYLLESGGVEVDRTDGLAFESVGFAPGLGPLGGSTRGSVHVRRERRWIRLPGTDFGWWMSALAPYRGGFSGMLASGTLVQYVGTVPCTDLSIRGTVSSARLAQVGDGLVVAGAIDDVAEILHLPAE